jgi:hypothetical protein
MGARKTKRVQEHRGAAVRRKAFHVFVETDSITAASRETGVPLGTLAGWLDHPDHAAELEGIRKAHACAVAENDAVIAKEAAAGLRAGIAVCTALLGRRREWIDDGGVKRTEFLSDGKEAAALTKALLHASVEFDRRARLGRGEATDRLELVGEERTTVDAELQELLGKPSVRAALKRFGVER